MTLHIFYLQQEFRLEISEWVAVFYPHKFYVGSVVKLPENGSPTIKFLDRRAGELFVYRRDSEMVEEKWIFCRNLKVSPKGKKEYFLEDYATIERKYEEFKKKYFLKEKVRSLIVVLIIIKKKTSSL